MATRTGSTILVLILLGGCATVEPARSGFVTPVLAAGVMSFAPGARIVPRAAEVNTQVARLLDHQQNAVPDQRVAAR